MTIALLFDITPDVILHTVNIRRNKKVKTPDAIIAATALVNGLVLVSRNIKDFNDIQGLGVIDPYLL